MIFMCITTYMKNHPDKTPNHYGSKTEHEKPTCSFCKTKFETMQSLVDHKPCCSARNKKLGRLRNRVLPKFLIQIAENQRVETATFLYLPR